MPAGGWPGLSARRLTDRIPRGSPSRPPRAEGIADAEVVFLIADHYNDAQVHLSRRGRIARGDSTDVLELADGGWAPMEWIIFECFVEPHQARCGYVRPGYADPLVLEGCFGPAGFDDDLFSLARMATHHIPV